MDNEKRGIAIWRCEPSLVPEPSSLSVDRSHSLTPDGVR